MRFAKFLVPVTGSPRDAIALKTAFEAARVFHAHVEVLFSHPDPSEAIPYVETPLPPNIVQDLFDQMRKASAVASKAARATLATTAEAAKVRIVGSPEKSDAVTASYVETEGRLEWSIEDAALLSDVIVFPPAAESEREDVHDAFINALTDTGRPVLLSPAAPPQHIGRKIAVGWDGGHAAARALSAALPYLAKAQAVEILSIRDKAADAGLDKLMV